MVDYHRFEKQYQVSIVNLWKRHISEDDKILIERFLKKNRSDGIGYARLRKLSQTLPMISEKLKVGFENAKESHIRDIVREYEEGDFSYWTRHDVKVIIKKFYKWLNNDEYPQPVKWINTTIPYSQKMQPKDSDLLTDEDIKKLIENTDHPRNKALIAVLAESGARIGEVGNLTINRVNVDANGAVLSVHGKTGSRRIRIITSTPYLVNWINNHPEKNNPHAPLWVSVGSKEYHQIMTYEGIRKIIKITFKKADIQKRCHPYIFRHTRACQLAHHLTEFQMNAYFGWVQGSDMPSTYIHISGKDLDQHILAINGIKPDTEKKFVKLQDRICSRCKTINTPTALYCTTCAEIADPSLALKTTVEKMKEENKRIKSPFLEWIQKDPEMRHVLAKKAEEFRTGNYN